jgi:hypothetical protein
VEAFDPTPLVTADLLEDLDRDWPARLEIFGPV